MENSITKRTIKDKCDIQITKFEGGLFMKCKNLNREPTAEEIIDSIKLKKIVVK